MASELGNVRSIGDAYSEILPGLLEELLPEFEGFQVAIDLNSGDYELQRDRNDFKAYDRLNARHTEARIWLTRLVEGEVVFRDGSATVKSSGNEN